MNETKNVNKANNNHGFIDFDFNNCEMLGGNHQNMIVGSHHNL